MEGTRRLQEAPRVGVHVFRENLKGELTVGMILEG